MGEVGLGTLRSPRPPRSGDRAPGRGSGSGEARSFQAARPARPCCASLTARRCAERSDTFPKAPDGRPVYGTRWLPSAPFAGRSVTVSEVRAWGTGFRPSAGQSLPEAGERRRAPSPSSFPQRPRTRAIGQERVRRLWARGPAAVPAQAALFLHLAARVGRRLQPSLTGGGLGSTGSVLIVERKAESVIS